MVMIEIQSDVDSDMAARMAAYVGMVYESLTPAARGTKNRYPAIFPLVVHTGRAEWNAADNLRDVADPIPGLAGHIAGRRYVRLLVAHDLSALVARKLSAFEGSARRPDEADGMAAGDEDAEVRGGV